MTLYEETHENFYEIMWGVREKLFDQIVDPRNADILGAITNFLRMENEYVFQIERRKFVPHDKTQQPRFVYTGDVEIGRASNATSAGFLDEIVKRVRRIADIAGEGFDTVAELGGGWGLNLFVLRQIVGDIIPAYVLAEYTETGRKLCGRFEGLRGARQLEKAFVDHKNPDLSFIKGSKRCLLFTCHSIEQIEFLPENYFKELCGAAADVVGIHLEPFGFQVDGNGRKNTTHASFIQGQGYNQNLFSRLQEAEGAGLLKVRSIEIERFSSQSENPTSVVVWDKLAP